MVESSQDNQATLGTSCMEGHSGCLIDELDAGEGLVLGWQERRKIYPNRVEMEGKKPHDPGLSELTGVPLIS